MKDPKMTNPSSSAAIGPISLEASRERVAELLRLAPAAVADDAHLAKLGLKSLQLMQLINEWRRAGLIVDFRELAADPTIGAWWAYLHRAGAAANRPQRDAPHRCARPYWRQTNEAH
ncbi:phosphopantetheine-binding protein [Embleya sp. AB8]|uniref:phosphopantetheine-binding protein n=1 Tax=Embleya sp. AB8 TaxID=3156304 RepID=UPI003C721C63